MNATDKIVCIICKEEKRASQFHRDPTTQTGYRDTCMKCNRASLTPLPKGCHSRVELFNASRDKNNEKIVECKKRGINWEKFQQLIWSVPINLDKSKKKTALQPKDRFVFEKRDKGRCYICGSVFLYGSCNVYSNNQKNYRLSHLHHIIPNGGIEPENIVTLCTHCHQLVHHALYIDGRWHYARPL